VCSSDFTVDGVTVPCGRFVAVSPHIVHRNAAVYPNPDVFDATRLSRGQGDVPNTFIPFGRGLHKVGGPTCVAEVPWWANGVPAVVFVVF
jgi:cytochrome P450